jgi:hypothetical protein
MTIFHITQTIEIKFWNAIIPVIEKEGILMKTIRSIKQISSEKAVRIAMLILIWAAVGFVSGMVIGRIILLLQIL